MPSMMCVFPNFPLTSAGTSSGACPLHHSTSVQSCIHLMLASEPWQYLLCQIDSLHLLLLSPLFLFYIHSTGIPSRRTTLHPGSTVRMPSHPTSSHIAATSAIVTN